MVEYVDGSVLAQLGNPDMRTPIAHALAWPDRIDAGVRQLDLARIGALDFAAPGAARFPCLRLAYAALRAGGSAPRAQRRQRSRGGALPRAPDRLHRTSPAYAKTMLARTR